MSQPILDVKSSPILRALQVRCRCCEQWGWETATVQVTSLCANPSDLLICSVAVASGGAKADFLVAGEDMSAACLTNFYPQAVTESRGRNTTGAGYPPIIPLSFPRRQSRVSVVQLVGRWRRRMLGMSDRPFSSTSLSHSHSN